MKENQPQPNNITESQSEELIEIADKLWCSSAVIVSTPSQQIKFIGGRPQINSTTPDKQIVYTCGSFDLCHAGTVKFLEQAKALGDCLVVGIFSDQLVRWMLGDQFPIVTLEHRALCLSALSVVDHIVLNAPSEQKDILVNIYIIFCYRRN